MKQEVHGCRFSSRCRSLVSLVTLGFTLCTVHSYASSSESALKSFYLMYLCAALIGPDLGPIAHTVSLVNIFFNLCQCTAIWGWRSDFLEEINEKSEVLMPIWRAWLWLPFDMLIPAISKNLGSRAHAAYLKGVFSSLIFGHNLTLRPYMYHGMKF